MQRNHLRKFLPVSPKIFAVVCCCCLVSHVHLVSADGDTDQNKKMPQDQDDQLTMDSDSLNKGDSISLSKKDIYFSDQAGFQVKRAHQIAAVKEILKLGDYAKQYKMVTIVLEKIFQMLSSSKIIITQSSYVPGHQFPEKEEELEALAHVVENTAFFGDLLLRMPDITHKIYKSKNDWRILAHWSIGFCNETGLFNGPNEKLISLVAQELNLIPRDPNYINPYKIENQQKQSSVKGGKEKQSKHKNKKKTKKKKGPRLSRTDL